MPRGNGDNLALIHAMDRLVRPAVDGFKVFKHSRNHSGAAFKAANRATQTTARFEIVSTLVFRHGQLVSSFRVLNQLRMLLIKSRDVLLGGLRLGGKYGKCWALRTSQPDRIPPAKFAKGT